MLNALVIFCLIVGATATSPLFLWTNTRYFNGKSIELTRMSKIGGKSFISEEGPLAKYLSEGRAQPEVVVVFVESENANPKTSDTHRASLAKLKETLDNSESSMIIKASEVDGSQLVMNLIQNLPAGALVSAIRSDGSDLISVLNGRPDVSFITLQQLSSGKVNLVVVALDSERTRDEQMKEVLQSMGNNYLAVLTSEKIQEKVRRQSTDPAGDVYDGWDDIIEAIFVMVPFAIILTIGICCTYSLQSGLKFDGERKKK